MPRWGFSHWEKRARRDKKGPDLGKLGMVTDHRWTTSSSKNKNIESRNSCFERLQSVSVLEWLYQSWLSSPNTRSSIKRIKRIGQLLFQFSSQDLLARCQVQVLFRPFFEVFSLCCVAQFPNRFADLAFGLYSFAVQEISMVSGSRIEVTLWPVVSM